MKLSFSLRSMVLAACALALSSQPALLPAADGTWTQNSNGDWGNATNWAGGEIAVGQGFTAFLSDVITTNRVINLDSARIIGNIFAQDTSQNYTISGANTLTLDVSSGIPVIDVVSGRTLTISSVIDGSDGLQKDGPGTLALTGANTYTGGNTITGGILSVNAAPSASVANGPLSLSGGGGLVILSTNISSSSQVSIVTGGGSIRVNGNNNFTTTGILTGSGTLSHNTPGGAGSRTLNFNSTANDFTGGIVINGLQEQFFQVNSLLDSSNNIAFTRTTANGTGTFRYGSGATTALTLTDRAFELNGGAGNVITGTIENANTTHAITINSNLVATGNGAKTLGLAGGNATPANVFAGVIANETDAGTGIVSVSKSGGSRWSLTNANNSYTGSTSVIGGTLQIATIADFGTASSIGAAASGAILMGNGNTTGTLLYTGGAQESNRTFQINSSTNNNTGGATIINDGTGALTFDAATFNDAYANIAAVHTRALTLGGTNNGFITGIIQDNSANSLVGVTKTGGGTWTLSGANTYSGLTTVSGGTLVLSGSNSSAGATTLNGATLQLNGASNGGLASGTLTISQNAAVLQAVNADRTISNAVLLNASPTISGSQSLAIDGVMTVNNNRTLTNNIASGSRLTLASLERDGANNRNFIHAGTGTTAVTGSLVLGTGTLTVNGGSLLVNGSTTTGAVTVATTGTLGGSGTIGSATTINGFLNPGNSPGELSFGSTLALAGTSTSTFEINGEARGTEYDGVNVATNLTLGGNLVFDFGTTFSPDTYVFNLFDVAGSTSGNFANVTLSGLYSGSLVNNAGTWELEDNGNTWTFVQSTGDLTFVAVPEPGTLALLAGGAVAGVTLLRRRRSNSI